MLIRASKRRRSAWIGNHAGLCTVLLLFLLSVCFVNPFREVVIEDDWAYALTVRHLLDTGQYRLNDLADANMPVQIYWGAALATLFGYSLTTLRFSTLILLFVALIAFYALLREFGSQDREASLLTLALLASPVVLFLGFTFMTDVPFLSWLILAFYLYARALRRGHYGVMALASVAAAAAIGTRQFGIALVAGLLVTWLLDPDRRRNASLYTVGLALPVFAGVWQVAFGLLTPTLSQSNTIDHEWRYLHDFVRVLTELAWRPTVILQYLGLFLLPVAPLCLLAVQDSWKSQRQAARQGGAVRRGTWQKFAGNPMAPMLGWMLYLTGGVLYGYGVRGHLMPYLDGFLGGLSRIPSIAIPATAVAVAIGALAGWQLCSRYCCPGFWGALPRTECLVASTSLVFLALHLLYFTLADEYLLVLLPLLLVARGQQSPVWPKRCSSSVAVLCLLVLFVSCSWTRGKLELEDAYRRAGETLRSAGVAPKQISANLVWDAYDSAFEEWKTDSRNANGIHVHFVEFLAQRRSKAPYWVMDGPPSGIGEPGQVLGRIAAYRNRFLCLNSFLRQRYVYILRRDRGVAGDPNAPQSGQRVSALFTRLGLDVETPGRRDGRVPVCHTSAR